MPRRVFSREGFSGNADNIRSAVVAGNRTECYLLTLFLVKSGGRFNGLFYFKMKFVLGREHFVFPALIFV